MFKQMLFASILVVSSLSANAQNILPDCATMAGLAEGMMKARQAGVPMKTTHKTVMETKEIRPLLEVLMKAAYNEPRYGSKEYQHRAVDEFASTWYSACLKMQRN